MRKSPKVQKKEPVRVDRLIFNGLSIKNSL